MANPVYVRRLSRRATALIIIGLALVVAGHVAALVAREPAYLIAGSVSAAAVFLAGGYWIGRTKAARDQ